MPFIEVTTREPIATEAKAALAEALSTTMLDIEIGGPTDAANERDWMWFRVLPAGDWAVGGCVDETFVRRRTMCVARIIAPEAFLNAELKRQAIAQVTEKIREILVSDPSDDGSGIWVHLTEIPDGQWGSAGKADPLPKLVDLMEGKVSAERRAEIKAHFAGIVEMKKVFRIQD